MKKEDESIGSVRVLHVDDEPDFAEMTGEYLEREGTGFEVVTAEDAEEALDILENDDGTDGETDRKAGARNGIHMGGGVGTADAVAATEAPGIDCVVSDYSMPGKNGIELLEAVRESYPDLPFILFTGKGSEEVASEAISAGVTDYLQKKTGTDQYKVLVKRIENAVSMRRSEKGLRETSEKLRAVLDTVEASVFMKDGKDRYILMNENCRDALGLGDQGVIGDTDHELLPEEVAGTMNEGDRRVLEKGETVEVEAEIPAPDGDRTHLILKSPVLNDEGEPYAVCGVSTDITERKERQKELLRISEEYTTVFENVQDPMFLVDVEDRDEFVFSRLNQAYEENTGISEEKARGKTPKEVFGEEEGSEIAERYRTCLEKGGTISYEETLNIPVGERTYKTYLSPVRVDGEILQIVGSARDITDRKERETELKRYEAIVENTSDLVTVIDEEGTVLYQSPSTHRVLGYDHEEAVGNNIFEYVHTDDSEDLAGEFSELLEDPEYEIGDAEYRFRHADGSSVWLSSSITDRRDTELGGFLMVSRNVTERKRKEKQTRQLKERLGLAIEGAELAVWDWEVGQDEVVYDDRWAEMLGMSPEEADYDIGYREEHAHPEDLREVNERLEEHVAGETERFEAEYRMWTSDGESDTDGDGDRDGYRDGDGDGDGGWKWIHTVGKAVERDDDGRAERVVGVHMDIDDRKKRENDLRRTKERLDLAVKGANLGIWDRDIKAGEVTYNDRWLEMLGMSPEDADTDVEFWERRIHPEDIEQTKDSLAEHFRGETESYDTEYRIRTADGDWKWMRSMGQAVDRDEDGRAKRTVGVHMDIDDRKKREEELRRYETFVEKSSDVLTHVSEDGTVLYQSPSVERVFGYGYGETVGDNIFEYAHPDDREKIIEEFDSILTDPERATGELEYRVRDADGDYVWVEAVGTDHRVTDTGGFVVNLREITERKEREQEVRQLKERLDLAVEGANLGIWDRDLESGEVAYNDQSLDILGLSDEEAEADLGFWEERSHPEDVSRVKKSLEEHFKGETERYDFEHRMRTGDGDWKWLRSTGHVVDRDEDGRAKRTVGVHMDIDDRKKRESELERYEAYIQNSSDITTQLDVDGTILYQSPSVEDVLGHRQGERVGESGFEYIHPDDRERALEQFESLLEGPEDFIRDIEVRYESADGDYVWLEITGSDQTDTEVGGVVVNSRDVTDRKEYERELKRSQDLLRRTERIADTGGWEIDLVTDEVLLTKGLCDVLGMPEGYEPTVEEAVGSYHPDDRGTIRRAIEECREHGEAFDEELRVSTPDGYSWVHVRGEPVQKEGDVVGMRGSVRDITELKERETELLLNNKVVRELYEITSDPDLSFEDKIEMVLESTRSRLGLPYAFVTKIDREGGTQKVTHARGSHELLQPGETCPLEQSYCRKTIEGEGLLVVHKAPEEGWEGDEAYEKFGHGCYIGAKLTVDDGLHGTLCFADTEPRKEEFTEFERTLVELVSNWVSYELERMRSKERLERQKERLDDFASVVSHDLRSPLTVLMGNLELAEETHDPDNFDSCRKAVKRMEAIIDDLLSLARDIDEVGKVEAVPLADVVEDCWHNTETKDADIHVETETVVMADRGKLRQMLDNLLRNAVEHGGDGVTVTVKDLPDSDGFRIEDDGPGIPEDERDRVMEAGYTTSEDGTGLGMYIVGQVAEAHGWDLNVTECEEGGASFEVAGVDKNG